ncbi:MAG: D-aminoacyl-tRNA deacylase [Spirochaetales bacterium]|nr:D-aminoacyl-tRNA deacylase [Spirochaetales bacterium]
MRAVVQRVSNASVTFLQGSTEVLAGSISQGIIVYLGVAANDTEQDASYLAEKVAYLRIFMDDQEKMNLSIQDLGYDALVVSQFTLLADARKGRRPSYSSAADPAMAQRLYEFFCNELRKLGVHVQTGRFQEIMRVSYINEGPVTILLDSGKLF